MFSSAPLLFSRLTEVEKIQLRNASEGQVDWMFHNIFKYEIGLPIEAARQLFGEVVSITKENFVKDSQGTGFGKTWVF